MTSVFKIAIASILVGCTILGVKFLAATVSGSTALFSDALESVVNVASSVIALYGLYIAAKPADATHQYGHDKAELISAVAIGVLIVVAALVIFDRAIIELLHPKPLLPLSGGLGVGLGLSALTCLINFAWFRTLKFFGRRWRSPSLTADAQHLASDVLANIGIILTLLGAGFLHWHILDPLAALAIALQIALMGGKTVLASVSGLLDAAPPPSIVNRMTDLVHQHGGGAIEAHDFRMRQAGPSSFLEFHLVVPGRMSVEAAHEICDRIEQAMQRELPGMVITIHIEPEPKAKREGVLLDWKDSVESEAPSDQTNL